MPTLVWQLALARPDVIGLVPLLLAGLALCWVVLAVYTHRMLTRPPRRGEGWAAARSLACSPAELTPARSFEAWSSGGCRAWDVRGDLPGGPVIVYTHGWGEGRWHALALLGELCAHGSRVILWDLPGHGESAGVTDLGGTGDEAALRGVIETAVGTSARVVLVGYSLGAGVSISLAKSLRERVIGVVALAPYRVPRTPAAGVLRARGLPDLGALWAGLMLVGVRFDRVDDAHTLACPLAVVHGALDEICPVIDGRAIAHSCARGMYQELSGTQHADLWSEARRRATSQALSRAMDWVMSERGSALGGVLGLDADLERADDQVDTGAHQRADEQRGEQHHPGPKEVGGRDQGA